MKPPRQLTNHPPERIDPLAESPGIVAHHITKYEFARMLVGKGRCLDVGCGVGYGSAHLADAQRLVFGIDADAQAITTGMTRYARPGLCFLRMDASRLAFRPRIFDAVICFEVIEHLETPLTHLEQVCRVLTPSGVYLLSTPKPGTGGDPSTNPFHHHEYSLKELRELLERYFSTVVVLGQRRQRTKSEQILRKADPLALRRLSWFRPIIRRLAPIAKARTTEDATIDDFAIDEEGLHSGSEFVAVCRDPVPVPLT